MKKIIESLLKTRIGQVIITSLMQNFILTLLARVSVNTKLTDIQKDIIKKYLNQILDDINNPAFRNYDRGI